MKRHGFIFKCFVDYENLPYSKVKEELEKVGFMDVSKADGIAQRAFFILPEYNVIRERFINNEFLPS